MIWSMGCGCGVMRREVIGFARWSGEFLGFPERVVAYAIEADGIVVYVGTTTQTIRNRIRAHFADAVGGSDLPIHKWMRSRDYKFNVRFLSEVSLAARQSEEKKWVKELGPDILNITDGGPGMSGNKFAGTGHAQKIAERLRQGANCACEVCTKSFWRKPRDIKRGHSRFCSRFCYQEWQRGKPKSRTGS